MKRVVLTQSDTAALAANIWKKKNMLRELDDDLKQMGESGRSRMLDNTPFLPTGPKAYQLVETEQYKKWLQTIRGSSPEKRWVGKGYFGIAEEYTEPSEKEYEKLLEGNDADRITETYVDKNGNRRVKIRDEYDPNHICDYAFSDLDEDDRKVFDFAAIKSKVVAHLEWKIDDLFDEIEESLREMHADDDGYAPPENLRDVIADMQKSEQIKMIENSQVPSGLLEKSTISDKRI